ncbi:MAG: AAA family ATPase [Chloroflexota bacterium]
MQLSILILASDRKAVASLAEELTAAGHGVTIATRPEEFAAAAASYSLVVLDRVPEPLRPQDIIGPLKASLAGAGIPVLAIAQSDSLDERIALLESGADEVINRPFQPAELLARVDAIALGFAHLTGSAGRSIGDPNAHRLIVVFSPKGGVGTTTLAVNLALVAASRYPGKVLLVDLDLSFGQIASHLDLRPKQTILDLVGDDVALRDAELFRTYAVQLPSGLHVLAAPPSPAFAGLIRGEHIDQLMARSAEAYDVVVVDAGTAMDDRLAGVFGRADTVIIPVLPEIPALNAVRLLLDQVADGGSLGSQTVFVLNNAFARELLRRTDIENALGHKVTADLPYDPILYLKAANEGIPVVIGAPKSLPAEKFRALADAVLGPVASVPSAADPRKDKKGLFGRR